MDMNLAPRGDPGPSSLAHMSRSASPSSPSKAIPRLRTRSPSRLHSRSRSRSHSQPLQEPPAHGAPGRSPSASSNDAAHSEGAEDSDEDEEDDDDDTEGDTEDDEEYERRRKKNMMENALILAELSLTNASSIFALQASQSHDTASPSSKPNPRRGRQKPQGERINRYGYAVDPPPPGKTQRLAAVEIPRCTIRKADYRDCTALAAGEERRWRFGDGAGVLAEGEEPGIVDGVADTFRWRPWEDVLRELEPSSDEDDVNLEPASPVKKPKVPYSMLTGATCHQCKRKSDKPKMRCCNAECLREYCSTCCARYDFDFDEESRNWVCPFCEDNCNCGACRAKKGKEPLGMSAFGRTEARLEAEKRGISLAKYLEETEGPSTRRAPFNCIRLVDAATCVLPPPLPQEVMDYFDELEGLKPSKKRKVVADGAGEGGKGKGKSKGCKGGGGTGGGKGKGKGRAAGERPREGESEGLGENQGDVGTPTPNGEASASIRTAPKKGRPKKRSLPASEQPAAGPSTSATPPPTIMLRFKPLPRKEYDSDGETVHGYTDDEAEPAPSNRQLRRSASTSTNASGERFHAPSVQPSTNEFLARLVAPEEEQQHALPVSDALMSEMDMDMNLNMDMDVDSPAGLDHMDRMERHDPVLGPFETDKHLRGDPTLSVFPSFPSTMTMATGPTTPNPPLTPQREWRATPTTPGLHSFGQGSLSLDTLGLLPDTAPDPLSAVFNPYRFQISPPGRDRDRERERGGRNHSERSRRASSSAERSPERRRANGQHENDPASASTSNSHGLGLSPGLRTSRSPSSSMTRGASTSFSATFVHSHHEESHTHDLPRLPQPASSNSLSEHFANYASIANSASTSASASANGNGSGSGSGSGSAAASSDERRQAAGSGSPWPSRHQDDGHDHDTRPRHAVHSPLKPLPEPHTHASPPLHTTPLAPPAAPLRAAHALTPPTPSQTAPLPPAHSPHRRPPPAQHIVRPPRYMQYQFQPQDGRRDDEDGDGPEHGDDGSGAGGDLDALETHVLTPVVPEKHELTNAVPRPAWWAS